jgi:hypothetical protein
MKKLLCVGAFVLSAGSAVLSAGSALAAPGTAVSTVNLRAEANTTSEILGKIPGGSRLEVGECSNGWCAVTWAGKSGFAIATALDTTGRARRVVRRGPPPGYDPDDDYVPVAPYPRPYVVGPPVVYGPGPYGYGGPYWGGGYWGPRWGWGGGWRRW